MYDAIRFCGRREVFRSTALCEFKGVFQHSVCPVPGKFRFLRHILLGRARMLDTADSTREPIITSETVNRVVFVGTDLGIVTARSDDIRHKLPLY